MMPEDIAMMEE